LSNKRDIPNLIRVNFPYNPETAENILLMRFSQNLKDGYILSADDSDLFCAIMIRQNGIEGMPQGLEAYCMENGQINDNVRFQMITLGLEKGELIDEDFKERYMTMRLQRAYKRKAIVKKEIGRVIRNADKLTLKNSDYYRELLTIITQMNDSLTLIDWFMPIQLTFERYVHIYVKHVEETKFGDGQFKNRSFFDYNHKEILTLIKSVLRSIEDDIKEHFLQAAIALKQPDEPLFSAWLKDFHRGWGKHPDLIYDNRKFRLSIDKYGIIQMFFQEK
jgi:hypothetical protein